MMVNTFDDDQVLVVLQIDHSRVAGMLAAHWGNDDFAPLMPYSSMVLAASEHDSGWWDWEIRPTLNDEGRPIDYIGSTKFLGPVWIEFYRHGVDRVYDRDTYAGYMVSMHADALLTQGMGLLPRMPDLRTDPAMSAFLAEQLGWREQLKKDLQASPRYAAASTEEHLWTNFKYMEVFDQLGQYVCNRFPLTSRARKQPSDTLSDLPIPTHPGQPDTQLSIEVEDDRSAVLRPYPFAVDPLPIVWTGRLLPNRAFDDEEDFLRHFYTAPPFTVEYELRSK